MQAAIAAPCSRLHTRAASRSNVCQPCACRPARTTRRQLLARAEAEGQEQQPTAGTPQPPEKDEPIWVRRERERALIAKEVKDLPFAVYLLSSAVAAIAAVGSVFEYTASRPAFGVIQADSPLYPLVLGTFAIAGLPTSTFLFFRAIAAANKESEQMDKLDGY